MLNTSRRLTVAAFAALALGAATSLAAQESDTVGPPQLKDYRLPGQRTSPPPTPQPVPPAATQPVPQPTARQPAPAADTSRPKANQPQSQPKRTEEPARRAAPAQAPTPTAGDANRAPAAPAPTALPPAAAPAPGIVPAAPGPAPARPATVAPAPAKPLPTGIWVMAGILLFALALLALRKLAAMRAARKRRAFLEERAAVRAAAAAAASPPLEPVEEGPRARLELSFAPDRAIATADETIVHYDMVLRNEGAAAAGNIRIDVRMFNASAQAAVGAFLKGPMHERSGSPEVSIEPGAELKLSSAIAMAKDEVRGIEVQGRSIFVPIVAINVAYDWTSEGGATGTGRTSRSWLVGREPETPSDKMGPFRLDLGPRIYRQVGQRPTELANVA